MSWPSFCVLRTFLRLFDVTIVSRIICRLYFLMSSLAFLLMVLAYSIRCLSCRFPPFLVVSSSWLVLVTISILDFSRLLIALSTLGALCWIMYVMFLLMVSMSSSSCSVSNRFINSTWNSIFFDSICAILTYN